MTKYVLYYTDSDYCGWHEISILGVYDSKYNAEDKIKSLVEASVNFDKFNEEIEKRNKEKIKDFLDKNSFIIRTPNTFSKEMQISFAIEKYNELINNISIWQDDKILSNYIDLSKVKYKPDLEDRKFWDNKSKDVYYKLNSFTIVETNYYPEPKYTGSPWE